MSYVVSAAPRGGALNTVPAQGAAHGWIPHKGGQQGGKLARLEFRGRDGGRLQGPSGLWSCFGTQATSGRYATWVAHTAKSSHPTGSRSLHATCDGWLAIRGTGVAPRAGLQVSARRSQGQTVRVGWGAGRSPGPVPGTGLDQEAWARRRYQATMPCRMGCGGGAGLGPLTGSWYEQSSN